MRCLLEQFARYHTETLDGIKVHLDEDEWVLIRPDADRPIFHVVAEARSGPAADEIVAKYKRIVSSLVQMLCSSAPNGDPVPLFQ